MPKLKKASELTNRFRSLVTRHAELRSKETTRLKRVLDDLLPNYLGERKKWAEGQRKSADEFNLFEVLEIDGNEVCHSMILAWLLDGRIEHGTHAQGNLGFQLFLEELASERGVATDAQRLIAHGHAARLRMRRHFEAIHVEALHRAVIRRSQVRPRGR